MPNYVVSGYNPEGYLDMAISGNEKVTLSGWALDRDAPNQPVEVHVYIDRAAGQEIFIASVIADVVRIDVNNATGISGNQGCG